VANDSILKQGSLQLGNVGWFWQRPSIAPYMIIQRIEIWRLKYQRGYFYIRVAVSLLVHFEKMHI